jgi:hypothetical protein
MVRKRRASKTSALTRAVAKVLKKIGKKVRTRRLRYASKTRTDWPNNAEGHRKAAKKGWKRRKAAAATRKRRTRATTRKRR